MVLLLQIFIHSVHIYVIYNIKQQQFYYPFYFFRTPVLCHLLLVSFTLQL